MNTRTLVTRIGSRKLLALLVLIAPCCHAFPHGEILSSGLCDPGRQRSSYQLPQSTAGYAVVADATITKETDVIPLRKGVAFGFHWIATGLPEVARIVYRYSHPLITRPDGVKLTTFDESATYDAKDGNLETVDCYQLSKDFELVPGDWTITILYEESPLVTRTFRIVK